MTTPETRPRRALILAGGGLKVAFQAGVLQVWLDELRDTDGGPVEFVHADGASGGVLTLAMWCQGMSGREIADNWRRFSPMRQAFGMSARGLLRGESLVTMERFRRNVLRGLWRLDWERIRGTTRSATFNVHDVTAGRLRVVPPAEMDEDLLVAGGSLPMWYPPVRTGGRTYIDAVFDTDANLDAAIDAGADELWIVWTVDATGRWRRGPIGTYFGMIEACANGQLDAALERIRRNNERVAAGLPSQYGRHITVRQLRSRVPVHYLLVFRRAAMARAVDQGVEAARRWCREGGFTVVPGPDEVPAGPGVGFRERMTGTAATAAGEVPVDLRLQVEIADIGAFLHDPRHTATVTGEVHGTALGGALPIVDGTVELLPRTAPGTGTRMDYRLDLRRPDGDVVRLRAVKRLSAGRWPRLWRETTRAATVVGGPDAPVGDGRPGTVRLTLPAFLRQLTTFRGSGPGGPGGPGGLGGALPVLRFGAFFVGRLAAVYLGRARTPTAFTEWPAEHHPLGARVHVRNERVIAAPPEEVWDRLVHARGWSSFYRNALAVRVDRRHPVLQPGTRFRWITFGLPIVSTVDRYEEGRLLGWRWSGPGARGHHLWLLEPHPDGCRVVTEETQRGPVPALLRPFLHPVMLAGHDHWLAGLAGLVEPAQGPAPAAGSRRGPGTAGAEAMTTA